MPRISAGLLVLGLLTPPLPARALPRKLGATAAEREDKTVYNLEGPAPALPKTLKPNTLYSVKEMGKNRKPTCRMSWEFSGVEVVDREWTHWLHADDVVKFSTRGQAGPVAIKVHGKADSGDDAVPDPTIWTVTYRGTIVP
jgi:hypothetical protein